jgi:hypothetical protein
MITREINATFNDFIRFLSYVESYSDSVKCWQWAGGYFKKGYGVFNIASGAFPAHRISYTALIGIIPQGLTLDHLCRNRGCVNPFHLEPVTAIENTKRGNSGINMRSKTHCKRGHEFNSENMKIGSRGARCCIICLKMLNHQCYERRKERLGPDGLKKQWREARERQKARI